MAPVALILGSGPRIGAALITRFKTLGYRVASVSRTPSSSAASDIHLQADFSDPSTIAPIFRSVVSQLGVPTLVIYNAGAVKAPVHKDNVLSVPLEDFVSVMNVNSTSAFVAAQEAASLWLSQDGQVNEEKKTFIYTGNGLNSIFWPQPFALTLGAGKSAAGYWVRSADANFKDKGIRFFYADERAENGDPMANGVNGDAHADFYAQLANHEGDVPSIATFVKGKGYAAF